MQCDALARSGADVTIYAKRAIFEQEDLASAIQQQYGVDFSKARLCTFWSKAHRGDNARIAIHAVMDLLANPWPDAILSRNLYAAYLIAIVLRKPLIFETHQLESGFRKYLQRAVMSCRHVSTIAISQKLIECLKDHHGKAPAHPFILHDAAPEGIEPTSYESRRADLGRLIPQAMGEWHGICGYFGHLYSGRGIEIIEDMAAVRPDVLFLVFGGNDGDVESRRLANSCTNLHYMGHVEHSQAQCIMRLVDVLLMPYQEIVSIGVSGHDTARWMSPMKMFEYMATGVPIISSDLPVLREVLKDGENALLVPPAESGAWISAMDRLLEDKELGRSIGLSAHEAYKVEHTWTKRAQSLLNIARAL